MFRDERQTNEACRILCKRALLEDHADEWRGEPLWTEHGPAARAIAMFDGETPLSSGERALLLTAFALWQRDETATVVNLLELDGPRLRDVGTLLTALGMGGPDAVDDWIAGHSD